MRKSKDISSVLIPENTTLKQALEKLSESAFNIIFVVDGNKKVLGSITDGDIRRALLRNLQLDDSVSQIMRKDFKAVDTQTPPQRIFALMRQNAVRQIPILDKDGKLKDVKVLEDFLENTNLGLPAVIMAGGRGTRLLPFTASTPKPLLKVGNRPVIERIIQNFASAGVTEVYVTVHYLAEQIEEYLGDGSRYGVQIEYVRESQALGTAGSLSLIRQKLSRDFFVANGDMMTNVDLKLLHQFHQEHKASATVCSKIFSVKVPYGVLKTEGTKVTQIEEKPDLALNVSSGIYLFSPDALGFVEDDTYLDMPHLIERLAQAGLGVHCFRSLEPWIDIGSHEDFQKAQRYLEYLTW